MPCLGPGPSPQGQPRLHCPHPRGSCKVRAREGRPPRYKCQRHQPAGVAHVRVEPEHARRVRIHGPGGAGRRCSRRRARGAVGTAGAGSPARSRVATTRRAAPRRPWPDQAPILLHATCRRRRLLRAARRLPSARPMGGGRHSRAERRGTTEGSSTGRRRAPPPPGRPPPGFLRFCSGHRRPAYPGTVQRAGSPTGGGA